MTYYRKVVHDGWHYNAEVELDRRERAHRGLIFKAWKAPLDDVPTAARVVRENAASVFRLRAECAEYRGLVAAHNARVK